MYRSYLDILCHLVLLVILNMIVLFFIKGNAMCNILYYYLVAQI